MLAAEFSIIRLYFKNSIPAPDLFDPIPDTGDQGLQISFLQSLREIKIGNLARHLTAFVRLREVPYYP